ncbi:STYKc [Musa troglodytarum]|uniref:STYKc n=1 Tax=Musa troglodytarum TaxID=320322 RepID=A0A9E7GCR9_9LILI|nr:STYKc [Musa troglodytarum]
MATGAEELRCRGMATGTTAKERKKKNLLRCRGNDGSGRRSKRAEEEESSSVLRERWQWAPKSCDVEGAMAMGAAAKKTTEEDVEVAPGYLDPEYMVTKMMTDKSDVYSYGVLLLELVVGKQASLNHRNLVQWSQELADSFRLSELVDPAIADAVDLEQLHVVVGIAKLCTQKEAKERPSIKQILRMLRERLDPSYTGFAKAVQGEGCHDDGRLFTEKQQENEFQAPERTTSPSGCDESEWVGLMPLTKALFTIASTLFFCFLTLVQNSEVEAVGITLQDLALQQMRSIQQQKPPHPVSTSSKVESVD